MKKKTTQQPDKANHFLEHEGMLAKEKYEMLEKTLRDEKNKR